MEEQQRATHLVESPRTAQIITSRRVSRTVEIEGVERELGGTARVLSHTKDNAIDSNVVVMWGRSEAMQLSTTSAIALIQALAIHLVIVGEVDAGKTIERAIEIGEHSARYPAVLYGDLKRIAWGDMPEVLAE